MGGRTPVNFYCRSTLGIFPSPKTIFLLTKKRKSHGVGTVTSKRGRPLSGNVPVAMLVLLTRVTNGDTCIGNLVCLQR